MAPYLNETTGTSRTDEQSNEHEGVGSSRSTPPVPGLWITGIASQYPPYLLGPEKLDEFAKRFFDVEKPG